MNSESNNWFVLVWNDRRLLALIPLASAQARGNKSLYLDWQTVVPFGRADPDLPGEATVDVNPGQANVCYYMRVFIYVGVTYAAAPEG
jgi:hypothetical protein